MRPTNPDIEQQLLSPAYVASPYDVLARLRAEYPVYWCGRWRAWLVTRYADVRRCFRNHAVLSNNGRYTEFLSGLSDRQQRELSYLREHYERGGLVQADPPHHTRLRKLVSFAFLPRIVRQLEPLVHEVINDLLDELDGETSIELVRSIAFPLPAIVIAGILGVPKDERDQFKHWSSSIQRFLGSGEVNFDLALEAQESWRQLNSYFRTLLAERRVQPADDMVSALAAACDDNDTLSEDEVVRTCGAMLIAGHETTTNLIASAIHLLATRPQDLAAVRDDESLYPSAVEEYLRLESPFQMIPRIVRGSVEMHGQTMQSGELVYLMIGAANRDERQFPRPDEVDIRRQENAHLAFGHGIHMCVGASLARLEGPVALRCLVRRLPGLRLDPHRPPVWKHSMIQRGLERLLLNFDRLAPRSVDLDAAHASVNKPHIDKESQKTSRRRNVSS